MPKSIAKKRARRRDPETRHRAPNGQHRVPKLVRLRADLNDYVEARAIARTPPNTWALELEILLDEARLKDRTRS